MSIRMFCVACVALAGLASFSDSGDIVLLSADGMKGVLEGGGAEFVVEPRACLRVDGQQVLVKLPGDTPVFIAPSTTLSWAWKKEQGTVCIMQLALHNPDTGQNRYFGYAAGAWSEAPSPDPTVEVFLDTGLPTEWTDVQRQPFGDIKTVLGWDRAQITGVYLSPWDGAPGCFADLALHEAASEPGQTPSWQTPTRTADGVYIPQRLKRADEKHVDRFETSFEECAPGRNSAANEWSAFGIEGDKDFNAMGRDLHVRYPVFDLVFRLFEGEKEIKPDTDDSFRLGLMNNRIPAIWGSWIHDGLHYTVTVMTVPGGELGNYDLYKLSIQNPTESPKPSNLFAVVEGPPDVRLEEGVVRGLGGAPFLVAADAGNVETVRRDWGLCDKRAKAYAMGDGPGQTEHAISTCRIGLDGVPVVYRFKADPRKRYAVCLAATPHIGGYYLETPKEPSDLVYEYHVEGCEPKTLDYIAYIREKPRPLFVSFDGARDADGDGYIEVSSGVAKESRVRHTRLSAVYVFPEGTAIENPENVYSGAMNGQCVWHIDAGATPEQSATNQDYDKSDIGFARLKIACADSIPPGETKTYYLKVPAIHRREPVSMGYIGHAFRDVLPGEGVPPFGDDKLAALEAADPVDAETRVVKYWDAFFAGAARVATPDPVLTDIFLSRLATRAILDVKIDEGVYYNPCSPFFYFDHAYRDQSYVVYAYDLAGLHERAARLLNAYCMDAAAIKRKGPISFDGQPLQLGMLENGLWKTRPGQYDTQGENIWALVEHYKLSGDRAWLETKAYPFIKRGAMWIVNSRHKHMAEVGNPGDPRYGLIEPGAMEVMDVGRGVHMYYLNAFAVLGLREAADAATALGLEEDAGLFARECSDLKQSLHQSFAQTFKRLSLYEGHLWFGVEPEGVGMYGFWAHNCLLWPCRCIEPQDPMLTATFRRMERMSNEWGGGMHSEGQGGYWPYIGVDRAVGHILRDEPEKALDYFCAFTDTAGGTFSWGEGYGNLTAGGDQPHFWADAQWIDLFRHLIVMEDGNTLMITPATFRRWTKGTASVDIHGLPTAFGDLDLTISPQSDGNHVDYTIGLKPKGDQSSRWPEKILLFPRLDCARPIKEVTFNGDKIVNFTNNVVILPRLEKGQEARVRVAVENE